MFEKLRKNFMMTTDALPLLGSVDFAVTHTNIIYLIYIATRNVRLS